jgi:hypothetical protein
MSRLILRAFIYNLIPASLSYCSALNPFWSIPKYEPQKTLVETVSGVGADQKVNCLSKSESF